MGSPPESLGCPHLGTAGKGHTLQEEMAGDREVLGPSPGQFHVSGLRPWSPGHWLSWLRGRFPSNPCSTSVKMSLELVFSPHLLSGPGDLVQWTNYPNAWQKTASCQSPWRREIQTEYVCDQADVYFLPSHSRAMKGRGKWGRGKI